MTHETIKLIFLCIFIFRAGVQFATEATMYTKNEQPIEKFIAGIIAIIIIYGSLIALSLQI